MQSKMLKLNLYEHHQFLIENIKRTSHHPSIALLAFADQDEESRRRQSGRWLIDDVAHHLSRFRYLSLAGRRASDMMHQRHATLDAVGQALRTRYLATGSVLWTTDNFHAMVRLIDSASGKQLWVSHYRMGRDRAADVEDDLAKEMATGLAVSIDALERSRLDQHDDTDDGFESATPLTLMAEHLTRQFQQRANERARQLALKACRTRSHVGTRACGFVTNPPPRWPLCLDIGSQEIDRARCRVCRTCHSARSAGGLGSC